MSRIGNKPINIPQGVEVNIKDKVVAVKGPKGQLEEIIMSNDISCIVKEDNIIIRKNDFWFKLIKIINFRKFKSRNTF